MVEQWETINPQPVIESIQASLGCDHVLDVVAGNVEDASRDCVREERPTQPSRLVGTTKKMRVYISLAD